MLRHRFIPTLLIHRRGLVKTVNFKGHKYVGDPINTVRLFNEKEVDEIAVFDIDATVEQREPDFRLIEQLAAECRMPLCYGGGVTNAEQAKKLVQLGVEKVAVSSAAVNNPLLISDMAQAIGRQSVVAVLDVKKGLLGGISAWTRNGSTRVARDPIDLATEFESLGIGELVLNLIDRDGTGRGYDCDAAKKFRAAVQVPMTVIGGAGSFDHFRQLFDQMGIVGAGAGSLFVFRGKYRAVLVSYPSLEQRLEIITQTSTIPLK